MLFDAALRKFVFCSVDIKVGNAHVNNILECWNWKTRSGENNSALWVKTSKERKGFIKWKV